MKLLGLAVLAFGAQDRCVPASVELSGPLVEVRLTVGDSRTVYAWPLRAGERRTVELPLGERPFDLEVEPTLAVVGDGAARFIGWSDPRAELPPALLARPRPPIEPPGQRPSDPVLALAAALALLTLALWRRPRSACVVALLGTGSVFLGQTIAPQPITHVRVIEGHGDTWMIVGSDVERLSLARLARVEVVPAGQPVTWFEDRKFLNVAARGALLHVLAPLDPGRRALAPDLNTWGDLEEVWSRSTDGAWAAHGRWALGEARGGALEGPGPPGWLAAGLPQGVAVTIARLAEGTWNGAALTHAPAAATWLRHVDP